MITIKPHHFIDIIKLYGGGIEKFVPCEAFGHDFYKVANEIIGNLDVELKLTIYGDDICKPCNRYNGTECTDALSGIDGFCKKEAYNRELDTRVLTLLNLKTDESYTARQFLNQLYQYNDVIFLVWKEEKCENTDKRNALFRKGCEKLIA
ncbi:MAG: DUF1284 domain-containing protein [Oscillospiraceae bacterium]